MLTGKPTQWFVSLGTGLSHTLLSGGGRLVLSHREGEQEEGKDVGKRERGVEREEEREEGDERKRRGQQGVEN